MKPFRQNRSRAYYWHHRRRVIQRKTKIAEHNGWHVRHTGYFAKGKVHCSCWMCTQKTNRDGLPHSQVIQWDRMNRQLGNYLNDQEI
ncbi:hypothetical protein CHH49_13300 [Terribacillus saccharophilus]|nr:hypothetical protein CHH49_13300 [Terribacillus saccharophilus]